MVMRLKSDQCLSRQHNKGAQSQPTVTRHNGDLTEPALQLKVFPLTEQLGIAGTPLRRLAAVEAA
jgi:hypothetical protein